MAPAPFFIVGSGRSGTTMLRLMLDAHPDVAVPAESHFVDELARAWPRYVRAGRIDADAVVRSIGKRLDLMGIPRGEARERLAALPTTAVSDAVDSVFRIYADAHGKSRWGDKTPGYVLSMPLLAEVFPGSRFVHLIRDGREVALSYADQPFGPRNVWETRQQRSFLHRGDPCPCAVETLALTSGIAEGKKSLTTSDTGYTMMACVKDFRDNGAKTREAPRA